MVGRITSLALKKSALILRTCELLSSVSKGTIREDWEHGPTYQEVVLQGISNYLGERTTQPNSMYSLQVDGIFFSCGQNIGLLKLKLEQGRCNSFKISSNSPERQMSGKVMSRAAAFEGGACLGRLGAHWPCGWIHCHFQNCNWVLLPRSASALVSLCLLLSVPALVLLLLLPCLLPSSQELESRSSADPPAQFWTF